MLEPYAVKVACTVLRGGKGSNPFSLTRVIRQRIGTVVSRPVEFLTDVILASGKNISDISIQSSSESDIVKHLQDQNQKAIAKAKEYKTKGGDDPLTILKMDNRTYDIFVRTQQVTMYEGEANKYEGKITLLKNRGREILETRIIKGTCGC